MATDEEVRVITQIITRPLTTITTIVTLGGAPSYTPSSTTTAPPAATDSPVPSTSLTREQVGALLGSIFGFAFLALLICCSLTFVRLRRRSRTTTIYVDDDGMTSESDGTRVVGEAYYSTRGWERRSGSVVSATWTTVPPPVRFPPTQMHTGVPYRQTRHPQMPGVTRYP